jgi:hypothetical protein
MTSEYPGQRARERCAERTREELAAVTYKRPAPGREQVRLSWMNSRCGTCGACPMLVRALGVMVASDAVAEATAVVFKLAS